MVGSPFAATAHEWQGHRRPNGGRLYFIETESNPCWLLPDGRISSYSEGD